MLLFGSQAIPVTDAWFEAAGAGPLAATARLVATIVLDPNLYEGAFATQEACEGGALGAPTGGAFKRLNRFVGSCTGAANGCREAILNCFANGIPDIDDGLMSPRAARCTPSSTECAALFVNCGCRSEHQGVTRFGNSACGDDICRSACRCGGGCLRGG